MAFDGCMRPVLRVHIRSSAMLWSRLLCIFHPRRRNGSVCLLCSVPAHARICKGKRAAHYAAGERMTATLLEKRVANKLIYIYAYHLHSHTARCQSVGPCTTDRLSIAVCLPSALDHTTPPYPPRSRQPLVLFLYFLLTIFARNNKQTTASLLFGVRSPCRRASASLRRQRCGC